MTPAGPPEWSGRGEEAALVALRTKAGLCERCCHAEILRSKRSAFLRCRRADQDARLPRYPGLPVLSCREFDPGLGVESERTPG